MKKIIVGVDPGAKGAIAFLCAKTKVFDYKDHSEYFPLLAYYARSKKYDIRGAIEKVGYRPTDGGRSAFSFGRNYGEWVLVDKTVKSDGVYTSVKFSDPVIHSVINAMGGWVALGLCSMDEWKWKQKEFERLYAIMSRQSEHPDHLPGQIELDNSALGYQKNTPDVKLIGPGVTKLPNSGRYLQ